MLGLEHQHIIDSFWQGSGQRRSGGQAVALGPGPPGPARPDRNRRADQAGRLGRNREGVTQKAHVILLAPYLFALSNIGFAYYFPAIESL